MAFPITPRKLAIVPYRAPPEEKREQRNEDSNDAPILPLPPPALETRMSRRSTRSYNQFEELGGFWALLTAGDLIWIPQPTVLVEYNLADEQVQEAMLLVAGQTMSDPCLLLVTAWTCWNHSWFPSPSYYPYLDAG